MSEFENKIIDGIHASRYVASYTHKVGKINFLFKDWLRQLVINGRNLTEEEIRYIYNYATNGKLELEDNAVVWLDKLRKEKNVMVGSLGIIGVEY